MLYVIHGQVTLCPTHSPLTFNHTTKPTSVTAPPQPTDYQYVHIQFCTSAEQTTTAAQLISDALHVSRGEEVQGTECAEVTNHDQTLLPGTAAISTLLILLQ